MIIDAQEIQAEVFRQQLMREMDKLRVEEFQTQGALNVLTAILAAAIMDLWILPEPEYSIERAKLKDTEAQCNLLEARIRTIGQKLLVMTPPPGFVEQFGWVLYMLYKEKHPSIDGKTQLRQALNGRSWTVHSLRENTIPLDTNWSPTVASPIRTETREFEKWALGPYGPCYRLAYLPASNIIAWVRV